MAKIFSRKGQLHYCSLITALVDDYAIDQQILSSKNSTPVLFFFMRIAKNEEVRNWLTDSKGDLKESSFLQVLNTLIAEDIFIVSKKSLVSSFLLDHGGLLAYANIRNIQSAMCRSMDPTIEDLVKEEYRKSFVDGF